MNEVIPLHKKGELTKDSWNEFVARMRHDCLGPGAEEHCTADAIFNVKTEELIFGLDADMGGDIYLFGHGSVWRSTKQFYSEIGRSGQEIFDKGMKARTGLLFLEACESDQVDLISSISSEISITYTYSRWDLVGVHLTMSSAEEYIRVNKHKHKGQLKIWTDSLYRFHELNVIREAIMSGKIGFIDQVTQV